MTCPIQSYTAFQSDDIALGHEVTTGIGEKALKKKSSQSESGISLWKKRASDNQTPLKQSDVYLHEANRRCIYK